jgi:hypothetical protein
MIMKIKKAVVVLFIILGVVAMSCNSSQKTCPAYSKVKAEKQIKG